MLLARDEISRPTIEPITRSRPKGDADELAHMRDVDLDKLVLQIYGKKKQSIDIRELVLSADFEEAIDATPTFSMTIYDPEWELLNSGALEHAIDIHVGKRRWYRLDDIDVSDDQITLTFITRNAAYLMLHNKRRHWSRAHHTRAEFVQMLVKSVKKTKIKFYCPELHKKQPIAKGQQAEVDIDTPSKRDEKRDHGLPDHGIKVAGHEADSEQLSNLESVLNVGQDLNATPRDLIIAVATVTQEAKARRGATNGQFVGLFQQSSRYGWPATRDPKKDAPAFFAKEIPFRKSHSGLTNGEIAQQVQGAIGGPINATYAHDVQQWVEEATDTVNEFLGGDMRTHGTTETYRAKYEFDSDPDEKGENYLAAIYRLGEDVNWRAYWVRDVLHFSDEERLFKGRARARIVRHQNGVETVRFGWAQHRKLNQMTITVRMDKWFCPVGTVAIFGSFGAAGGNAPHEGGPARGRWLVNNIQRSVFSDLATVTLTKPITKKKEPAADLKTRSVGDDGKIVGDIEGTPKDVIDNAVLPLARRILKNPSLTAEAVEQANARHGPTVSGGRSDHQGPPETAWAADMSNGTSPTPEMDRLAKELAEAFDIPWNGSGLVNKQTEQYRFQLIYRTNAGGNHYNHVHFGVKLVKPLAQNRPVNLDDLVSKKRSGGP